MDHLLIATASYGFLRAVALDSTETVREAQQRHQSWPVATAALGRTLSVAAMMSASLKDKQHLTLRILGDGPVGAIVANADDSGIVRGYIQEPHVDLPPNALGKLDVGTAVGKGLLHVTKDLGMRTPFNGQVALSSGEIGEDFAQYFWESEQLPSVVAVGVLVDTDHHVLAAGGYLIQILPGADEELIEFVEQRVLEQPMITTMLSDGLSPEAILHILLDEIGLKILERRDVRFQCRCNRERLEQTLMSLGKAELEDMIAVQGGAELTCHFCREVYRFSIEELDGLIARINAGEGKQEEVPLQ